MHVYIPVLPESLLGVLGAPMPYLVGVHSSFLTTNDGKGESVLLIIHDYNIWLQFDSPQFYRVPHVQMYSDTVIDTDMLECSSILAP